MRKKKLRDCPIPRPSHSPGITTLHFVIGICVKERVFAKNVLDIEELKRRVREVFGSITSAMLRITWRETEFRLQTLQETHGEHVDMIQFTTCRLNE